MSEKLEVWKTIYYKNTDGNDPRNTVAKYDTFYDYEKNVSILGYGQAPDTIAARVLYYVGHLECGAKVLDIGAGSGLVGKSLREHGYKGELHGIDGSNGMLEQAKRKRIYDDMFCQFLSEETPMLVANESYDGVVSSAAFNHGYIGYKVLSQVVDALKPGGILVITVINNKSAPEYRVNFAEYLENLRKQGLVEKVEISTIDCYYSVDYTNGITPDGNEKNSTAKLFCYKKL